MSQLALFVALHLLGVVLCVAIGPWRRIWLCVAAGFAVGLACGLFLALAALLLGVFRVEVMVTLYAALLAGGIAASARRERWSRASVVAAALGTLGFAALCVPFCRYNFSALSYDSHMFVLYGRVLGDDGQMTLDMLQRLNAWGVFQVVAQALSVFVKQDYLYGLAPAFAVSMLATFAVVLDEALGELGVARRLRVLWIALALGVLLAIPLFRFHVVYIHANMGSAGYLFLFVGLYWLAEVKREPSYLPIAFLALLAFTVMRVEAVPFALIFLLLTVIGTGLARRDVLPWYAAYTAVVLGWFTLLAFLVPADSVYLTPTKCLLFATAIVLAFAYWLVSERGWFRHLTRYVPHLALVACGLGIVAAYLTNEANMRESAGIWLEDLWSSPWWASIWKWIALLALVGVVLPAPPNRRSLVLGVWLFFGVVLIVSSTGTAFGPDIDGSLIRMTLHILPIVFFYGALKFAPLLTSGSLAATRAR